MHIAMIAVWSDSPAERDMMRRVGLVVQRPPKQCGSRSGSKRTLTLSSRSKPSNWVKELEEKRGEW